MPEVTADRIGYVCVQDRNVYWEYGGRENPASRTAGRLPSSRCIKSDRRRF